LGLGEMVLGEMGQNPILIDGIAGVCYNSHITRDNAHVCY